MQIIYNWSIKRAGAGLTISGVDEHCERVKLVEAAEVSIVGDGDKMIVYAKGATGTALAELSPRRMKLVLE